MAAALQDKDAPSLVRLGLTLQSKGQLQEAIVVMNMACKKDPTMYSAFLYLGHLLCDIDRVRDATGLYRHAVKLDSSRHDAHLGLACAFQELRDHRSAVVSFSAAAQCSTLRGQERADCYFNLANSLCELRETAQAEAAYEKSIAASETPEACNNLGNLLWEQGDAVRALKMFERCCALAPDSSVFLQNQLMSLNYVPDMPMLQIFQAHRSWGEQFSHKIGQAWNDWPSLSRDPSRKLRIGYLSPDFFKHSTSYFARCLVEHSDAEMFDVFLYSNTLQEDETTEMFRSAISEGRWRRVNGMTHQEAGELIRKDCIDILVDLAGHTANNRLDIMARKPAPVQFTWMGYQNTTGLGAIDYLITDDIVDVVDTRQPFVEELARLPQCLACYTPPSDIPDVGSLPAAAEDSPVTFGSFNQIVKLSPSCIALWAQLMKEVPNSKLLLKAKGFSSNDVKARITAVFEQQGIPAERLILQPTSKDHLHIYTTQVDIALDTFPYSSPTTACEAMLMGVPVVCLEGGTHCARRAMTLVSIVGFADELIASTRDEYVCKAKSLASNPERLAKMRQQLRPALLASPLCDGRDFVRGRLEPLLRQKWRLFCEGRPPSAQQLAALPGETSASTVLGSCAD